MGVITVAFVSYACVMSFTPGPNNVMSLSSSSRMGLRCGLRFCFGVLCGSLIVISACAIGGAALLSFMPKIEPVMKGAGAAFLLYLAWQIFKDKACITMTEAGSFVTGIMMQFVNPKIYVYAITTLSTFVLPVDRSPVALASSVLTMSCIGFAGVTSWTLFGSTFSKVFANHRRVLNTTMALLLIYCVVKMFV